LENDNGNLAGVKLAMGWAKPGLIVEIKLFKYGRPAGEWAGMS